jgi:predicted SpoU family rRNA methylase
MEEYRLISKDGVLVDSEWTTSLKYAIEDFSTRYEGEYVIEVNEQSFEVIL